MRQARSGRHRVTPRPVPLVVDAGLCLAHHGGVRWARASSVALLASAYSAACTPHAFLELPDVPGVRSWLVVASSDDETILRAQVLAPDQAYRLILPEEPTVRLEALAFASELPVPAGELPILAEGDRLPAAAATFAADLVDPDRPTWRTAMASARALALRVPPQPDRCPDYAVSLERIAEGDDEGVVAMVRIGASEQVVVLRDRWLLIDSARTRELPVVVPGVLAASRAHAGTVLVANGEAVWAVVGEDPFTSTASRAYAVLEGEVTFSIASPQPGGVYGLTTSGRLFYADSSTATVVHRFESAGQTFRGAVVEDGTGVLAVFGDDPEFVRVDLAGRVTRLSLPERGEYATSIGRLGTLGIVVGTTAGNLRAERLEFQPLADPDNLIPNGVTLRTLSVWDDRMYFGGASGLFGTVSARGKICVPPVQAGSIVRFVGELGRGAVAVGRPLLAADAEVYLSRFILED